MRISVTTMLFSVLVLAGVSSCVSADESEAAAVKQEKAVETPPKTVSVKAGDSKIREIIESLETQSGEKMIIESTVKGTLASLSLTDVALEPALTAVCSAAKCQWRKVYISPASKLLEQPDKLAATVRLMSGLSFPDMVLAASSLDKVAIHCSEKNSVRAAEGSLVKDLGMTKVYLVTNDAAIARSGDQENSKRDSENERVNKYVDTNREMMDLFMKMSPEEQERAIVDSIMMMEQVDPRYMSAAMRAVLNTDPEVIKRMTSAQTRFLFEMEPEQRRAMMKLNMEAMKSLTPEQMKILQEDALAIAQETAPAGPDQPAP